MDTMGNVSPPELRTKEEGKRRKGGSGENRGESEGERGRRKRAKEGRKKGRVEEVMGGGKVE